MRDRMEDLPLLVQAFINEFNARNGRSVEAVDPAAMRILEGYGWPGNVRELRNVIEHATILARDRFIETAHLPAALWEAGRTDQRDGALRPGMTVDEAERRLILMTLDYTRDNKTRAASMLGFSLKTLYNKLKRLKLPEEQEDEGG
jgi:two-component system, NtrC family, response regulator HydG